jgi:hypothetical protein
MALIDASSVIIYLIAYSYMSRGRVVGVANDHEVDGSGIESWDSPSLL